MAFAAETSRRGVLAYLETDYSGGGGLQAATLWGGGATAIRPISMTADEGRQRPRATWPINAALRGLGVVAASGMDEFDTFGLAPYRSLDVIRERALPVRL